MFRCKTYYIRADGNTTAELAKRVRTLVGSGTDTLEFYTAKEKYFYDEK